MLGHRFGGYRHQRHLVGPAALARAARAAGDTVLIDFGPEAPGRRFQILELTIEEAAHGRIERLPGLRIDRPEQHRPAGLHRVEMRGDLRQPRRIAVECAGDRAIGDTAR